MCGSNLLINQAGWNRCNLICPIYLSLLAIPSRSGALHAKLRSDIRKLSLSLSKKPPEEKDTKKSDTLGPVVHFQPRERDITSVPASLAD